MEKADKEIKKMNKKYDLSNFSKELKTIDKDLDKTKKVIAEKERKKKEEEERKRKAEEEKRKAQLTQTKNEFLNKAAALENEIKIKWENSTETGTVQVGGLVYDDYEKWEALMNEVLDTIKKIYLILNITI